MTGPGSITSRFADLLGIRYPVVQEGLGPYKTVKLAAAVSNAGGLGTVSIPGLTDPDGPAVLRAYIEEACSLTDRPFAVNVPVGRDATGKVLPFSASYVGVVVDAVQDPEIARRLRMITTSAGAPGVVRDVIADSGLIHAHKVGGTRQAVRAAQDGVDVIVASGYEAGGHTHARPVHTMVLGPSVCAAVDVPVVLAGGIHNGAGMAAALALGADAVAMGTRFVASHDNTDWHPNYAQKIIDTAEGDDVVFSAIYGPSRALPTRALRELAEIEDRVDIDTLTAWKDDRLIRGQRDGEMEAGVLPAGNVSGAITDLIHVAEFIPALVEETIAVLDGVRSRVRTPSPTSP
ncbi:MULTISPECIES: NAD(P)H-dependent flavin oxidoreductase [Amycolatopsis]|uniref:NAD(P)H-dependent flavin oxidoreductase n=1 Tax=Amycolatopsis TaxID=1813 RepID=UPI0018E93719|nr:MULTISPECIES: nitronate monooxygenase [Amycolatopsis]